MHARARKKELCGDEWDAPSGNDDPFAHNDLLRSVLGLLDEPSSESDVRDLYEGARRDSSRNAPPEPPRPEAPSQQELIEASQRVRQQCDDLVRKYDATVRSEPRTGTARRKPRTTRADSTARPRAAARTRPQVSEGRSELTDNAAKRKKALLLMLIEELL